MSSAISRPSSSAQRPAEEAALLEGGSALSDELATASEQPALHEQPPRGMLASFNCTVAGVVMLHLYVYLTVVFCVIVPWLSWSVPGLLNLGIFSANTGTALLCFLACVVADPGRVPPDYQPDLESQPVVQVKRKSGEARFCQKCSRHKPPRAHHCRVCKRCVLRMDHHCPWINNCVGHGNYKAFMLFLIYVNAAVVHALGLLCAHALHYMAMLGENRRHAIRTVGPKGGALGGALSVEADAVKGNVVWAVLQTVCLALTLPLAIGLAMLLGWNLYLALSNKTTIEFHEGVTASIQAGKAGAAAYQHPYDLGLCGNLHALCGHNPSTWLVPTAAAVHGDGLAYPTTYDRASDDLFAL